MSSIRVDQITDASGGNSAVLNGVVNAPGGMNFRNRILNGDFRIDQRNNGASVTVVSDGPYATDRWTFQSNLSSKCTAQRNGGGVALPAGFTNYLGITSTSAYSLAASDHCELVQYVEGFNIGDLAWGTANAQAVTLSFLVRSSITGTFGGTIGNSAQNRSYVFSYTINAANTFETKTITIPGDTAGTWLADSGLGMRVRFGIGVGTNFTAAAGSWYGSTLLSATGAVNVLGTAGATWAITGVQLEAGTVATPFERVDFGTQLMRCQRYLPAWVATSASNHPLAMATSGNGSTGTATLPFMVTPRVPPTGITVSSASHYQFGWYSNNNTITNIAFFEASLSGVLVGTTFTSSPGANIVGFFNSINANAKILCTGCEL